jgi:hypothetical protein
VSPEEERGKLAPGDWDGITRAEAVRLLLEAQQELDPVSTLVRWWRRLLAWLRWW